MVLYKLTNRRNKKHGSENAWPHLWSGTHYNQRMCSSEPNLTHLQHLGSKEHHLSRAPETQDDKIPWSEGALKLNVLFHFCNFPGLWALSVTRAQLMRDYFLRLYNITICFHLYISKTSERPELNLYVSGFLVLLYVKRKKVFTFLRANRCVMKFRMCWFLFETQTSKLPSLTGRLRVGKRWLQLIGVSSSNRFNKLLTAPILKSHGNIIRIFVLRGKI